MKNMNVKVFDWINYGEPLIEGHCDSDEVNNFLLKGKCQCEDECEQCGGTGRIDEVYVVWEDESNTENVYEYLWGY